MTSCLHCTNDIKATASKYCSIQCQQDAQFDVRYEAWLQGASEHTHRWLRRALTKLRGYQCSICKISEWNGEPITLEVEHKDGNSENNSIPNLCLICPNCHSQTPTYKARNRGNGRHLRRVRYANGQSY